VEFLSIVYAIFVGRMPKKGDSIATAPDNHRSDSVVITTEASLEKIGHCAPWQSCARASYKHFQLLRQRESNGYGDEKATLRRRCISGNLYGSGDGGGGDGGGSYKTPQQTHDTKLGGAKTKESGDA